MLYLSLHCENKQKEDGFDPFKKHLNKMSQIKKKIIPDATVEAHLHHVPLPDSNQERPICLKITCTGETFYLSSHDDHVVLNVWFQKLREVASSGEQNEVDFDTYLRYTYLPKVHLPT